MRQPAFFHPSASMSCQSIKEWLASRRKGSCQNFACSGWSIFRAGTVLKPHGQSQTHAITRKNSLAVRRESCDAPSHLQHPRSVVFLQINLPCSDHQKQILPNCTSACSLLISPNKWHPFSSHMAQLVCNANTRRTLALLIPEELVPALCLKA